MIGTVRRIHLLTALVLLLAGLARPLAAAQGVTCARSHGPGQTAQQPTGWAADEVVDAADGPDARSIEHRHDSAPQPGPAGTPSAPCGVAALPVERSLPSLFLTTRYLLPRSDLPPASLVVQSLFRPPRLS